MWRNMPISLQATLSPVQYLHMAATDIWTQDIITLELGFHSKQFEGPVNDGV